MKYLHCQTHDCTLPIIMVKRRKAQEECGTMAKRPTETTIGNMSLIMSGTVHTRYRGGEDLSSHVSLLKKQSGELARRGSKRESTRGRSSRSTVSLLDLIEKGIIRPGKDVIECRYKKKAGVATLKETGGIYFDGNDFATVTAFSIYFKRKFTPSKLGDDGWKSVYYKGECMDTYRKEYYGT